MKIISFIALHAKPHNMKKYFRISFDEVDGDIEKGRRDQYQSLFHPKEKYDWMFDRIKYLISQISNISDVYYRSYMKIRINSNDNPSLEKTLNT